MATKPEVTDIKDAQSGNILVLRITQLDDIGELTGGPTREYLLIKGLIGSPQGRLIGSPGDLAVRQDVPQLWQKITGERTRTGWSLLTPEGGLALCNSLPQPISAGSAGTAGIAGEASRCDHTHPVPVAQPITVVGSNNVSGVSTSLSRSDHQHRLEVRVQEAAALVGSRPTINFAGSGVAVADNPGNDRVDITISGGASPGGTPNALAVGQVGAPGVSALFAREDHDHAVPVGTPITISPNANVQGIATTFARSDHQHQLTAGVAVADDIAVYDGSDWQATQLSTVVPAAGGVPNALAVGQVGAAGVSVLYAREDHDHAVPVGTPISISSNENVEGVATTFARSDHQHQLTAGVAVSGDIAVFDGSDWQATAFQPTVAGETGLPLNEMVFYIDPENPTSYDGTSPPTEIVDLRGTYAAPGAVNNITMAEGHFEYNGTTSNINMGTLPAELVDIFDGGGALEAWVQPESSGGGGAGRIADTTQGVNTSGWFLVTTQQSGNFVRLGFARVFATGERQWNTTNVVVRIDQWHHIVVIYDGSSDANSPTILIDGIVFTVANGGLTLAVPGTGAPQSDAGNDLLIGNRIGLDRGWDGDIERVLLYPRLLSTTEALHLRRKGFSRLDPNLIGIDQTTATKDVVVRPGDSTGATAGSLTARAGDHTGAAAGTQDGGDTTVRAGDTNGAANSSRGGDMTVRAGDYLGAGAAGGGGNFLARAGDGRATATATIRSGNVTSGGNTPGAMTVAGGDNTSTGPGGPTVVRGGDATANLQGGGILAMRGGDGRSIGTGDVLILAGRQNAGGGAAQGGDIRITTTTQTVPVFGASPSTFNESGDITIDTETGTDGLVSGDITIQTGDVPRNSSSAIVGDVNIGAGDSNGTTNSPAGDINLLAGDTIDAGADAGSPGGSILMAAGDSIKNSATSQAGSVAMSAGTATTGALTPAGNVEMNAGDAVTEVLRGAVTMQTSTDGSGSAKRYKTRTVQTAAGTGQVSVDLEVMATDDRNKKIEILTTAQQGSVNGADYKVGVASRAAGTITFPMVFIDNTIPNGLDLVVNLAQNGDNIQAQITATVGGAAVVANVTLCWWTQEGGMVP